MKRKGSYGGGRANKYARYASAAVNTASRVYKAYKFGRKVYDKATGKTGARTARADRGRGGKSNVRRKNGGGVHEMIGHIGGTASSYKFNAGKRSLGKGLMKRLLPIQHYLLDKSGNCGSSQPGQAIADVNLDLGTNFDLNSLFSQEANTLSVQAGGASVPAVNASSQIWLQSISGFVMMSNSSRMTVELDIYECTPQRDTQYSCGAVWQSGMQDVSVPVGSATSSSFFGSLPSDSPKFRHFWRILKRQRIQLAPGAVHKHNFVYEYRKILSKEMTATSNVAYYRGWSHSIMLVGRGYPVHNSVQVGVTNAGVSIDYTLASKFSYKFVTPISEALYSLDQRPALNENSDLFANEFTTVPGSGNPVV